MKRFSTSLLLSAVIAKNELAQTGSGFDQATGLNENVFKDVETLGNWIGFKQGQWATNDEVDPAVKLAKTDLWSFFHLVEEEMF